MDNRNKKTLWASISGVLTAVFGVIGALKESFPLWAVVAVVVGGAILSA